MTGNAIRPVIIIADFFNDKKSLALDELVGASQKIRRCYSAPLKLLVITGDDKARALNWVRKTGLDGIIIQVPGLTGYHGEIYKTVFFRNSPGDECRLHLPAPYLLGHGTGTGPGHATGRRLQLRLSWRLQVKKSRCCFRGSSAMPNASQK